MPASTAATSCEVQTRVHRSCPISGNVAGGGVLVEATSGGLSGLFGGKYAAGRINHDRPAASKDFRLSCCSASWRASLVSPRGLIGSIRAQARREQFSSHQASRNDRYQRNGSAAARRLRAGHAEFESEPEDREAGQFGPALQRHRCDQAAYRAECDWSASQIEKLDG